MPEPADPSVWRETGAPLVAGRPGGPLAGLRVAVKDLFAVAGHPVGAGVPAYLAAAPPEARTASTVTALLDAGADVSRHRAHRRVRVQHRGRQPALRHPAERRGPGRPARRLLERSCLGGRARPGGHRPRDRHRRLHPGARLLPGALGTADDARPGAPRRTAAARAELRHRRLAHPRRRRPCTPRGRRPGRSSSARTGPRPRTSPSIPRRSPHSMRRCRRPWRTSSPGWPPSGALSRRSTSATSRRSRPPSASCRPSRRGRRTVRG